VFVTFHQITLMQVVDLH